MRIPVLFTEATGQGVGSGNVHAHPAGAADIVAATCNLAAQPVQLGRSSSPCQPSPLFLAANAFSGRTGVGTGKRSNSGGEGGIRTPGTP